MAAGAVAGRKKEVSVEIEVAEAVAPWKMGQAAAAQDIMVQEAVVGTTVDRAAISVETVDSECAGWLPKGLPSVFWFERQQLGERTVAVAIGSITREPGQDTAPVGLSRKDQSARVNVPFFTWTMTMESTPRPLWSSGVIL